MAETQGSGSKTEATINIQKYTHVPEESKKFIGMVRVFVRETPTEQIFMGLYNEHDLVAVSSAAREVLANQTTIPKVMVVHEVNAKVLKYVLTAAIHYGHRVRLNMHGRPMLDAISILDVVETLGVIPPQMQVEGYLVHLLTHNTISPAAMTAVHRAFGPQGKNSRTWRVMVHQIAWDVAHGSLTGQRLNDMETAAREYADLNKAIIDRIKYLKGCMEHKNQEERKHQAPNNKREFMDGKRRGQKPRKKNHSKSDSRSSKAHSGSNNSKSGESIANSVPAKPTINSNKPSSFHEKKEQRWYEEENGLRETSENTIAYLKFHKPTGFWVKTKMSQREKKQALRVDGQDHADATETNDAEHEAVEDDQDAFDTAEDDDYAESDGGVDVEA